MSRLPTEALSLVEGISGQVTAWRRHLHQNPELSFQEFETAKYVEGVLRSLGNLEIQKPTATSVTARLKGAKPGRVLAIRADIDALPITEENAVPYVSQKPGVMHACGHDAHTSILLGTATVLSRLQNYLEGEILFIFQHAEEVPPGGASELVAAGVMTGVDKIIGLHVASNIPTGKIGIGAGAITADGMNGLIKVIGKGGHSSAPEQSIDPVAIGAQIVINLQAVVARYASPFENLVLSTTRFNTPGEAFNVTPPYATLGINARGNMADFRSRVPVQVERIVKGVCEAHGATYEFSHQFSYPAVVNDADLTAQMTAIGKEVYGEDIFVPKPLMGGEDFSAYLTKAPGCMLWLGTGNPAKESNFPHHHPRFDVDEDGLIRGVQMFVRAAFTL